MCILPFVSCELLFSAFGESGDWRRSRERSPVFAGYFLWKMADRARRALQFALMRHEVDQDAVCAFVRAIVSARTGEPVDLVGRPDVDNRIDEAPDEEWRSPSRSYAVEHTRIEPFQGQIENLKDVERLFVPVKEKLDGQLPGTFELAFPQNPRGDAKSVCEEAIRLVLAAADDMAVKETRTLRSDRLRFEMTLYCRHKDRSRLVLVSNIPGIPDDMRLDRVRRAFKKKSGKLAKWKGNGYTSLLVLESNDIQNSNASEIFGVVKRILSERNDHPDIIVLVETEVTPMYGHVLKEGDRLGDDVPQPNGVAYYTEGGL